MLGAGLRSLIRLAHNGTNNNRSYHDPKGGNPLESLGVLSGM